MRSNRWTEERARQWSQSVGWLVGCNFTPSTAANQLEMWQQATYDPDTIGRELQWASEIGMNVVRVYLHDLLWSEREPNFLDRVSEVLDLAAEVGIQALPVLFDGVWNPAPALGPQPTPVPGRHNSVWVQSPGADILHDPSAWPRLEAYVHAVLERFGSDERIIAWDLFNEPDQLDRNTLAAGSRSHKAAAMTNLVGAVFDWARDAHPTQPLTVGLWEYDDDGQPVGNAINSLILERSDIISFHCYEPRERLNSVIDALSQYQRPLLCTEWLARTAGSTVDLLEVFGDRNVGAINWGLVDGRTQTKLPWRSWWEQVDEDEPWFHELFHRDGTPYDRDETDLFRRLTRRTRE